MSASEGQLKPRVTTEVVWPYLRHENSYVGKRTMIMETEDKIKRTRPRRRWSEHISEDLEDKSLRQTETNVGSTSMTAIPHKDGTSGEE